MPAEISDIFVGREREMEQLTTALDDAMSGRGRIVMLAGEPGIGKTRLSEELAARAVPQNVRVIWGRCHERAGAPPYWPWVQVIRTYLSTTTEEELAKDIGQAAAVIAEIVPEVAEKIHGLEPPTRIEDPESARFRLFDSITTFLKSASRLQPIAIVLEDLHWSDKPSLMLLEFLANSISDSGLLVVGTYRDVDLNRRHPLAEVLGDLARQRLFERLQLRGLGRAEVERLIEATAGVRPTGSLVDAVYSQTEGNALFVAETVKLLAEEGSLTPERLEEGLWELRLPEGVKEVIGRRLNRLSDDCNRVLTNAALVGRQFRLDVLEKLIEDSSTDRLLDLLDEALDARIVEEVPTEIGLYQFTHAVMQDTLTSELSANRLVRLHARIAEALEEFYGDEAEDHSPELAGHFAEAETVLGAEKLIHYAITAGRRALDAVAPAPAADYFQIGINAFGDREPDGRLAEMLGGLGRAQVSILERNEFQQAVDNLTRSFDLHLEDGNVEAAVRVASTQTMSIHGPTGLADLHERALNYVDDGSIKQGRLLAEFGLWVSHERANYAAAADAFERALSIATVNNDSRLELRIHSNAAPVHYWNRHMDEHLASGLRAIELAERLDDPVSVDAHFTIGNEYMRRGDIAAARTHAEALVPLAERTRSVFHWTTAMYINAAIETVIGNWDAAKDFINRGLERSPTERRLIKSLINVEFTIGNIDDALKLLEKEDMDGVALGVMCGAPVTISAELEREAWEPVESSTVEPFAKQTALGGLGLAAIARRDPSLATRVYEHPLLGSFSKKGWGSWQLGAIADLAGDREVAEVRFVDAIGFCRDTGYRPDLATASAFYSEMLLDRNDPGDREKATEMQDEAISIARELGMKPLLARLEALRNDAASGGRGKAHHPDNLSDREAEVLRLVAVGKSNQDIADELFISRFTVVRHVTNIFAKTGAANRAEATSYAYRHGLAG